MADVQQAAEWMTEGKKVRRENWAQGCFIRSSPAGFFRDDRGEEVRWMMIADLLAEDWGIFEYIN